MHSPRVSRTARASRTSLHWRRTFLRHFRPSSMNQFLWQLDGFSKMQRCQQQRWKRHQPQSRQPKLERECSVTKLVSPFADY